MNLFPDPPVRFDWKDLDGKKVRIYVQESEDEKYRYTLVSCVDKHGKIYVIHEGCQALYRREVPNL